MFKLNVTVTTARKIHVTLLLFQNISRPTAKPQHDFESFLGGPHVWVGGDMSSLSKSGYDPVFYMHQAYVDYLWEIFRQRQRYFCRLDPSLDYPEVPTGRSNHADAPMIGFDLFTNKDGIRNHWIDNWYNYQREPSCPYCCRGCPEPAPIYCDRRRYVCVSRSTWSDGFIAKSILQGRTSEFGKTMPRHRGKLFDAPLSDGRTIFTAVQDTLTAARDWRS